MVEYSLDKLVVRDPALSAQANLGSRTSAQLTSPTVPPLLTNA